MSTTDTTTPAGRDDWERQASGRITRWEWRQSFGPLEGSAAVGQTSLVNGKQEQSGGEGATPATDPSAPHKAPPAVEGDEQMTEPLDWSGHYSLVIRTDFEHDAEWQQVQAAIVEPQTQDEFTPNVAFVDDPQYDGLTVTQLLDLLPDDADASAAFLVDRQTLTHSDRPILVVNLCDYDEDTPGKRKGPQFGHTFRVTPTDMWSVENNLSLANMDWEEFADRLDADGVHRGFGDYRYQS